MEKFHIVPWIANLPAGLASITFVFFNKYITFRNKERSRAQTMRFILVYSCAFVGELHLLRGSVVAPRAVSAGQGDRCRHGGYYQLLPVARLYFQKVEHLPDVVTV